MIALLLAAALAAPADDDLRDLEGDLRALEAVTFSADPMAAKDDAEALAQALRALGRHVEGAVAHGGSAHKTRVLTRFAEGHLLAARAMATAPCPPVLSPDLCTTYRAELARVADGLLDKAAPALERARQEAVLGDQGVDKLRRADRKRLAAVDDGVARLHEELTSLQVAAKPPESIGVFRTPDPPQVLGRPGPGWADLPDAPAPWSDGPPDTASNYVKVSQAATFSQHADGSGQAFHGAVSSGPAGVEPFWTARLVRVEEDRALVELGAGQAQHQCDHRAPWDGAWRVRVWVDAGAFLPVVTAPFEESHPDGTRIAARPGAVVLGDAVVLGRLLVPARVPADHVGTRFHEAPGPETPAEDTVSLPVDVALSVGGAPATVVSGDYPLWAVPLDEERLRLVSTCGTVDLRAPAWRETQSGAVGGILGALADGDRVEIQAGTPLLWPDGSRAGTAVADRTLDKKRLWDGDGGLRCWTLYSDPTHTPDEDGDVARLDVCVAP